jgi:hypothetical protein
VYSVSGPRLAGILYLVIISARLFAEFAVRSQLTAGGDPAAIAARILSSEVLFRAGFAVDLVMLLADIGVAVLLYRWLESVNRTVALASMVLRLTMFLDIHSHGYDLGLVFFGASNLALAIRLIRLRQASQPNMPPVNTA